MRDFQFKGWTKRAVRGWLGALVQSQGNSEKVGTGRHGWDNTEEQQEHVEGMKPARMATGDTRTATGDARLATSL